MADIRRRYVNTKEAAAYMGVHPVTFGRMITALPAAKRPRLIVREYLAGHEKAHAMCFLR